MSLAKEFQWALNQNGHAMGYEWVSADEVLAQFVRRYHREIHQALLTMEKK